MGGEATYVRGQALDEVHASVVGRLRARRLEIEQVIFARVRDGVFDPVGHGDAEYVEGLRVAVAAVVDYGLMGMGGAEGALEPIPLAAVMQARRAARAGVGLDTVLRRYVAGCALLEDFVMQEADHSDTAGQRTVRGLLRTSAALLDRLITAITGAYMLEVERAERSPEGRDVMPARDQGRQSSCNSYNTATAVGGGGSPVILDVGFERPVALLARAQPPGQVAVALPAMLGNPTARRARECLLFLAEHPESSNREVAVGIGIAHQSQISKLLSCLVQESLVAKRSEGAGRRNAWRLTPRGEQIARAMAQRLG